MRKTVMWPDTEAEAICIERPNLSLKGGGAGKSQLHGAATVGYADMRLCPQLAKLR